VFVDDVHEDAVEADPDRCPASGMPTLMGRPLMLIPPQPLTSRSTSTAGNSGVAAGSGEGPAGLPPSLRRRARSRWDSRDGQLLIRAPSAVRTWSRSVSAHTVMGRPARAGPSQICCWAIIRLPEAGTIRSTWTG
jgi:hypothetical protein